MNRYSAHILASHLDFAGVQTGAQRQTDLLRRRAEATLWSDRLDPATVRAFFAKERPTTAKGRFALARALLLQGERAAAQNLVRETWRYDNFSAEVETLALDMFQELITAADHKARMDMRLYADDTEAALRAADRAGRPGLLAGAPPRPDLAGFSPGAAVGGPAWRHPQFPAGADL